jgi:hypothetical protein
MPQQVDALREVRKALRKAAKRICYQCKTETPHRDDTSVRYRNGTSHYIHVRSKTMATSLTRGDDCRAPEVWREFEAAGGVVRVRAPKSH